MTTPFSLLLSLSGLSHREAGEFLCVRLDTIRSWSSGRNRCPDGALDDLKKLISKQTRTASEALDQISRLETRHGSPDAVELGEPLHDDDAQSIGWPCVGAWRGMAARVIAGAPNGIVIAIVPRGCAVICEPADIFVSAIDVDCSAAQVAEKLSALGIRWDRYEAQPIADQYVFRRCSGLPSQLPLWARRHPSASKTRL